MFQAIINFILSLFAKKADAPIAPVIPIKPLPQAANDDLLPPAGSSPVSLSELHDNARKWETLKTNDADLVLLKSTCDKIESIEKSSKLYSSLEGQVGIDRWFIAAMHYREADFDMLGCLANGDKVVGPEAMRKGLKTTNIPVGKGPYPDFESSAVEAINDELRAKGWKRPPVGIADTIAFTERYNGLGPRKHGINSGYDWGGTNYESLGGYSSDGKWDPSRVEKRLGVAVIAKEMKRRELSISPIDLPVTPPVSNPPLQIYSKLMDLAKSANLSLEPIKQLIEIHNRLTPSKQLRHWAVIDFSSPSKSKRLYWFDTTEMKFEKHLVAHGAGSDTNNDGVPERFSNVDGSHMSSLGIVRCAELYQSMGETRMRLDGLEPSNSNVRSRAIVMHSANYVNESTGSCGRSWGCTVVDHAVLPKMVNSLYGGSLMNLWKGS